MDATLTIYRLRNVGEIPKLQELLDQLGSHAEVRLSKRRTPAVAGELAGQLLEILLLPEVQAIATAAALGDLLWKIINHVRAAGKYLRIGKGIVKSVLLADAKQKLEEDGSLEDAIVWGPMEVVVLPGFDLKPGFDRDGETPEAYFLAIAIPRSKQRVRTVYYLLSADGEIRASWWTQTLVQRIPEFLRPSAPRKRTGKKVKHTAKRRQ